MSKIEYLEKQRNIFSILCCPICKGAIEFVDATVFFGMPIECRINCPKCGDVGFVENFRSYFNAENSRKKNFKTENIIDGGISLVETSLMDFTQSPVNSWSFRDGRLFSEVPNSILFVETQALGIEIRFLMHSWSGKVEIRVDDEIRLLLDLYEATGSRVSNHPLYLGKGAHIVQIKFLGVSNDEALGAQVWLDGIDLLEKLSTPNNQLIYSSFNSGNGYPSAFDEILRSMPESALVLDCGCGDRRHPDRRVVGFEYGSFRGPDVFGDGHHLPFADGSFDFILSQAVIEHLYDPRLACVELHRILKPGGILYVESAFMQPLHAVPYHFFNTTAWGLAELLSPFEILETRHEGKLHQTLDWIYSLTALRLKGYGNKIDSILDAARDLDQYITDEELRSFSSFVAIKARKYLKNSLQE